MNTLQMHKIILQCKELAMYVYEILTCRPKPLSKAFFTYFTTLVPAFLASCCCNKYTQLILYQCYEAILNSSIVGKKILNT